MRWILRGKDYPFTMRIAQENLPEDHKWYLDDWRNSNHRFFIVLEDGVDEALGFYAYNVHNLRISHLYVFKKEMKIDVLCSMINHGMCLTYNFQGQVRTGVRVENDSPFKAVLRHIMEVYGFELDREDERFTDYRGGYIKCVE